MLEKTRAVSVTFGGSLLWELYGITKVVLYFLKEFCIFYRVDVCSLLLSHGADPTLLNCHSKSAVDVCPSDDLQEKLQCKQNAFLFLHIRHTVQ